MKTSAQISEEIKAEGRAVEALKNRINAKRERIQWLTREYEVTK